MILLYPVMFLPVILAYVARYAFEARWLQPGPFDCGGDRATFYWIAMESAVRTASVRRQKIL